jgi:hypothetical protein
MTKKEKTKLQENLFSLKVEFHQLTGEYAGEKPYRYSTKYPPQKNIYIASILGAIVAYEIMLNIADVKGD